MASEQSLITEDASPDPEFLIKSIAEQGYSLETSLADLIDNSISAGANKIEILIDTESEPFTLFLADNGKGMDNTELIKNMQFPSSSPEAHRELNDLGRFGLGMKTASFAQTRCFTVLSKKAGDKTYNARTWDVEYLRSKKQWKIIVDSEEETKLIVEQYNRLSKGFLNEFDGFSPNTIVVWKGLYKFENYLSESNRKSELKKEITEITSEYLSLVFHRFLESETSPLSIRINNTVIKPFNPFPTDQSDFRKQESNRKQFQSDSLKIEGYILPARSLDESKESNSLWTQQNKSLTDMEGMYIYRANRIILYGGWNDIIKKSPRLQLARLKVDIGNSVDKYFHLNVAKSSIIIPHELRIAFLRYVNELKHEAEKEYFNRGIKRISVTKDKTTEQLFVRTPSDKGMLLEVNSDFSLLKKLSDQLNDDQNKILKIIFRMINTTLNKVRQVHEDKNFNVIEERHNVVTEDLLYAIDQLKKNGITAKQIRENFIPAMGIKEDSLPAPIIELLSK